MAETKDKLKKLMDSYTKTFKRFVEMNSPTTNKKKPKEGEFKYRPKQTE